MRKPFAAWLLALAGLVLSAGAVAGAAPAAAAACPSTAGVTVVVDYGSLGGTSVGCARTLGSGLDVLESAGHSVAYLPRQQGFVCTIDRRPDPCNGAPTTAYWSYWHATPGGSWSYSTVGAASSKPKSGTVEGWAFGAGKPPAMRPPARPRPATSTTTSRPTSRTTTSRPASTTGPGAAGGSTSRTTAPSGSASKRATAPASGPPATSTEAGAPAPTTDGTYQALTATRTDAAAPTSATSASGGAGSLVAAGVLVLALAGGATVFGWRRRRPNP